MNLKLRSTLCLLTMSPLFMDGAIAQPGRTPGVQDWKAKLAMDYNAGNYRAAIADAAALQKLDALDPQTARVTAQAYYKAGDFAGCVKYIKENLNPTDSIGAQLSARCQASN
jgi:hypothetical protein